MAVYTYRQFRKVLRKLGFYRDRSRKHEVWLLEEEGRIIRKVVISHQSGRDIPRWLFQRMLKQAGIASEEEFRRLLKE